MSDPPLRAAPPKEAMVGAFRFVVDNARAVRREAEGAVDHAARAASGLLEETERRSLRVIRTAADEATGVVADLDHRVTRQRHGLVRDAHELADAIDHRVARQRRGLLSDANELADSVMDRIAATAMSAALFYAAYTYRGLVEHQPDHLLSSFSLFWVGTTMMTLVIATVWVLFGRTNRLRHLVIWQCYIIALTGIVTGTVWLMRGVALLS